MDLICFENGHIRSFFEETRKSRREMRELKINKMPTERYRDDLNFVRTKIIVCRPFVNGSNGFGSIFLRKTSLYGGHRKVFNSVF